MALLNTCVSAQYSFELLAGSGAVQEDSSEGQSCQREAVISYCNQIPQQQVLLWLGQPRLNTATEWCTSHGLTAFCCVMSKCYKPGVVTAPLTLNYCQRSGNAVKRQGQRHGTHDMTSPRRDDIISIWSSTFRFDKHRLPWLTWFFIPFLGIPQTSRWHLWQQGFCGKPDVGVYG